MRKQTDCTWAFVFMQKERDDYAKIGAVGLAEGWDRLLSSGGDPEFIKALKSVSALLDQEEQRKRFLICLADTASAWKPAQVKAQRAALAEIRALHAEVEKDALSLAKKLARIQDLSNEHSVGKTDGMALADCLQRFAMIDRFVDYPRRNHSDYYLFKRYPLPQLDLLFGQYSSKYWPDMHGLLTALATLARDAVRGPGVYYDNVSASAGDSRESSPRDFFRAWMQRMSNDTVTNEFDDGEFVQGWIDAGKLPPDLVNNIPNSTFAALVNAALGITEMTSDNVRKVRGETKKRTNDQK